MPRRRNRFSRLDQEFRNSGGQAAPGSRLEGYIQFKRGERRITVSQRLTSTERERLGAAILPFGVTPPGTPTAADRYQVAVTRYSYTQLANLGLSNNRLGYDPSEASTRRDENFFPALLRAFVRTSPTPTTPISGITGKEYTRIPGRTYSFPFGRTITDVTDKETGAAETTVNEADEIDVKNSLIVTVKASAADVTSVSYEPELFRSGRPALDPIGS